MSSTKRDVWVIGGTSGIGKAVTELVMEDGLSVHATGPEVDVRSEHALRMAYRTMDEPPFIVYSAGINQLMWNRQQQMDIVTDLFDVNVFGFMRLIKVLANVRPNYNRSVVAVSSDAARRPMRTSMAYCASKAALDACVRQAAREHAPRRITDTYIQPGILVNAVSPGMTAPTGMSEYIDRTVPRIRDWTPEQAREYEASQNPMGDYRISPAEIATAVRYMLLDSPLSQTGSIMEINCGR